MKDLKQYRLLISCPSDCEQFKDTVIHMLAITNHFCETFLGARIQHIYYKENVATGTANEAQEVISRSLRGDFDSYVGLFWSRLGTPTAGHKSGAVEELELAYEMNEVSGQVGIHVYFCEAEIPMELWKTSTPQDIMWLRSHVGSRGTLYKSFTTATQLQSLLSVDLVADLKRLALGSSDNKKRHTVDPVDPSIIVDFLESITRRFNQLQERTVLMSTAMREFSACMEKRTAEINRIGRMNKPFAVKGAVEGVFNRIVNDMRVLDGHYQDYLEHSTPTVRECMIELQLMTEVLGIARRVPAMKNFYAALGVLRETAADSTSKFVGSKGALLKFPASNRAVFEAKTSLFTAYDQVEALLVSLIAGLDNALLLYEKK